MWITGRTYMAKAIIFGMAASAIGIFSYVQLGMEPKIMWAGLNAVIGGLLFGFGIVLAAAAKPAGCTAPLKVRCTTGGSGWATSLVRRSWPISGMICHRAGHQLG
jgi:uncharacterized membrane protein YedE/YeeE